VTEARGRQARLKPGLGKLYPGVEAGAWRTVEDLLRHVTILIDKRLADPRTITGERLLRDDHFEFRATRIGRRVGPPICRAWRTQALRRHGPRSSATGTPRGAPSERCKDSRRPLEGRNRRLGLPRQTRIT
jgi:hypothetical protein